MLPDDKRKREEEIAVEREWQDRETDRRTHCLFYNTLLQMGLLFKCSTIVQPNANVYSYTPRKHL